MKITTEYGENEAIYPLGSCIIACVASPDATALNNMVHAKMASHELDEPEKTDKTNSTPPAQGNSRIIISKACPDTLQPAVPQGSFYLENQTKLNISLGISDRESHRKWLGELQFKCRDVPRLMREGLHWNLDNVSWEDGFFSPTSSAGREFEVDFWMTNLLGGDGYTQTRHYFLRDIQEEPPRWVAHFLIHGVTTKVLADFRLDKISVEHVEHAVARSNLGERFIYRYNRKDPKETFNAIYDDMPMEGWWPWPKKGYPY
ncbi:uncharacterized protein GGS22DRAFT_75335 [Annulohypoxylon maeteangense]|uniref:uncharacterized protein n=1 Tax=Annulohypoxylon maeteangense TaxID=1927788 RepID=UPI002008536B|nr:uncharacterized protein GGS22DRAFT_75335 [Annulohypoxylon maeteangense]KAI0881072.1 hypothetical protein GGS22DRAFT_75335 [Annulohypoxylon maeteangense]